MKKIITIGILPAVVLLFILLGWGQTSCTQNTNCLVDIYVVDTTGHSGVQTPVSGANVKLWENINPQGTLNAPITGTTDNSGHFQYTFKLPGIYNITATYQTMTGTGLIQLVVGGTATQTVLIK